MKESAKSLHRLLAPWEYQVLLSALIRLSKILNLGLDVLDYEIGDLHIWTDERGERHYVIKK